MSTDPRLLLAEHHRETEAACKSLLARTYADDPRALIEQFRSFERGLREHLAAEEELILPAYAEHDPAEARTIRADHDAIRKALDRLGLEVELHVVRATSVDAMVASLRAHAAREDASMYPWAQNHLPDETRHELSARIHRNGGPHEGTRPDRIQRNHVAAVAPRAVAEPRSRGG